MPPCTDDSLDFLNGHSECCSATKSWKHQHDIILNFMKHGIQPPHFVPERDQEHLRDLEQAKRALPSYQLKTSDKSTMWNKNPRIFSCYHNIPDDPGSLKEASLCNLFTRSYTNTGFWNSYNRGNFWDYHNISNEFNKIFFSTMYPQLGKDGEKVRYPKAIGPKYGLAVSVQPSIYNERSLNRKGKKPLELTAIRVAIHDPDHPADLRGAGIEVEPGFLTTFLLTPSQTKTSVAAKGLDPAQRGCRFKEESGGLNIFSRYSQKGCEFECVLAQALEECQCIPWNYPRFNLSVAACDFLGASCFEKVKSNRNMLTTLGKNKEGISSSSIIL